jgi:hypothetical protein
MAERSQTGTIEDAVKNPRLQALVRYWHSKRDGRSIPSRQRIDPIEIPRILPIVLMADVTTTGARMRLLGTDTTATYGQETRGKWVHEFKFGEFTTVWLEAFAQVTRSGISACAHGRYCSGTQHYAIETVLMPLSNDSLSVTHVFGGLAISHLPLSNSIERELLKPSIHLAGEVMFPKALQRQQ